MPARRGGATASATGEYATLLRSYKRALMAAGRSPNTLRTYLGMLEAFGAYLARVGMPTAIGDITREHVSEFLIEEAGRHSAHTVATRHRALRAFFAWLVEEGEIRESPMARVKAPAVPEAPPRVLSEDDLRKLLKACAGSDFIHLRDTAIVWVLISSGVRRTELASLTLEDVDLDAGTVAVMGKGRRPRVAAIGAKTVRALDRYLRARARHPHAANQRLWLGPAGPIAAWTIYHTVRRRAEEAGLGRVWPHVLRHTFAHRWLAAEGSEGDLARLGGWRSRAVMARYGASMATERAIQAHRRLGLDDRV